MSQHAVTSSLKQSPKQKQSSELSWWGWIKYVASDLVQQANHYNYDIYVDSDEEKDVANAIVPVSGPRSSYSRMLDDDTGFSVSPMELLMNMVRGVQNTLGSKLSPFIFLTMLKSINAEKFCGYFFGSLNKTVYKYCYNENFPDYTAPVLEKIADGAFGATPVSWVFRKFVYERLATIQANESSYVRATFSRRTRDVANLFTEDGIEGLMREAKDQLQAEINANSITRGVVWMTYLVFVLLVIASIVGCCQLSRYCKDREEDVNNNNDNELEVFAVNNDGGDDEYPQEVDEGAEHVVNIR